MHRKQEKGMIGRKTTSRLPVRLFIYSLKVYINFSNSFCHKLMMHNNHNKISVTLNKVVCFKILSFLVFFLIMMQIKTLVSRFTNKLN